MQADIQEIYQKTISPLDDREKLQIATLILEDVTGKTTGENGQSIEESGNQNSEPVHALTLLAQIKLEGAPSNLSERHDFYAHGKSDE